MSFSTVALIVDVNDIFCFFKLLVINYSILLAVTSSCVTRNKLNLRYQSEEVVAHVIIIKVIGLFAW